MSAPQLDNPAVSEPEIPETNGSRDGKLSSTLVTNIVIISIVGTVSILLMLFGDFQGKFSRVFSTLLLFGAFVFFSSYDLKRDKDKIQVAISQIGNSYMLVISLILIWGSLAISKYEDLSLFPYTCLIIMVVKLGTVVTQQVSNLTKAPQQQLRLSSTLATAGIAATTVLFSLPLGFHNMVDFPEGYWKFAVAVILFAGLTLSITLLVKWAFLRSSEPKPLAGANDFSFPAVEEPSRRNWNDEAASTGREIPIEPSVTNHAEHLTQPVQPNLPQFEAPIAAAFPWPVFPNGQPLPARENGRPDFAALQVFAEQCIKSEQQFFN